MLQNKSFLQSLIFFLIDTTPRYKFNLFVRLTREFINGAKETLIFTIRSYKSLSARVIYLSTGLHLIAFMSLFSTEVYSYMSDDTEKVIKEKLLEVKNDPSLKSPENQELVEITGIYYIAPEDLKSWSKSPKPKKKEKKINSLLSAFKGPSKSSWKVSSNTSKQTSNIPTKTPRTNQISKGPKGDWRSFIKESKVSKKDVNIEKYLNQQISKHNNKFKQCYEQVLLKDNSLNATVHFSFRFNANNEAANPNVSVKGVGLPQSKAELTTCLKKVVRSIKVAGKSKNLSGQKVKFQVVLNSWK